MFNVVLHEPEIPNNTGNIGRTCVATGSSLHLIKPLGFDIDEKACRRAGLDYWPRLDLHTHSDLESYQASTRGSARWYLSTSGGRCVYDADFKPGDHLVFGKESKGLPRDVLNSAPDRVLCLPMMPDERSLNLSSVVCVVVYEAIRQSLARQDTELDTNGRLVGSRKS
jgi:tRNA (cytidine/uridine-2'-O-)-methyltransferase